MPPGGWWRGRAPPTVGDVASAADTDRATGDAGATVVVVSAHPLLGEGICAYLTRAGLDVVVVPADCVAVPAVGVRTRLVVVDGDRLAALPRLPELPAEATVVDVSDTMLAGRRGASAVDLDAILALAGDGA